MNKEAILKKMSALTEKQSTSELCKAFELTNNLDDKAAPIVREVLMDELEKRNPEAFELWIDSDEPNEIEHPSLFFV